MWDAFLPIAIRVCTVPANDNGFVMQFEMTVLHSLLLLFRNTSSIWVILWFLAKLKMISPALWKKAIDRECGYFGTFLLIKKVGIFIYLLLLQFSNEWLQLAAMQHWAITCGLLNQHAKPWVPLCRTRLSFALVNIPPQHPSPSPCLPSMGLFYP